MTTHIIFLRHGQTTLNAEGKIRGKSSIDLDSTGIKQARKAGENILKECGGVDVVYSSSLPRITHTAKLASDALGYTKDIKKDEGLDSLDYGQLEGLSSDLVDKLVVEFIKTKPFQKIGGTGESFQNFKTRYLKTFLDIINSNKNKRILIVSSSTGDRLLNAWIKAGAKLDYSVSPDEWMKTPLKNGEYHHWYGIWSSEVGLL